MFSHISSESTWTIIVKNCLNGDKWPFREEEKKIIITTKDKLVDLITIDLEERIVTTQGPNSEVFEENCKAFNSIRELLGSFKIVW